MQPFWTLARRELAGYFVSLTGYIIIAAAVFLMGLSFVVLLGILLLGGLFVALGCCASALTRSQGVAAMISLLFGVTLFFLGFLASQLPVLATWQAQVLACFALHDQMHDFARGVVDTRPVV